MKDRIGLARATRGTPRPAALCLVAAAALGTAAASVPARAAGDVPQLTISYSEKVGDEVALWIASDAGYFKQHGVDVKVIYLPAQQGIPALLTGQIQMASIGGPDGLSAEAQGAKLQYVATLSPVYTFQFWTLPKYAHAAALKGQRVGVSSTTGSLYSATVISLKELGLTPSDVQITPLGSVPNVDSAFLAGSIVAAASHPPATYAFRQHHFVDLVDLAQKRIPAINTGLASSESYIQSHSAIVQDVVDAVIDALKREKSDKAYAEDEMRKYMGVKSKAVLDFTYDYYAGEVAPTIPMPEVSQLAAAQRSIGATNAKVLSVNVADMINQSFVKKATAK